MTNVAFEYPACTLDGDRRGSTDTLTPVARERVYAFTAGGGTEKAALGGGAYLRRVPQAIEPSTVGVGWAW